LSDRDPGAAANELRGGRRPQAVVSIACLVVAAAAVVALHFLRRDLDPVRRHLSEYAVGEFGALMTTVFLSAAAGAGALAVLYSTEVASSRSLRVACGAIAAAALCEAAMAVFVSDLSVPAPGEVLVRTTHGRIHDVLALLHGIGWTVAVVALPIALRRDARWRGFVAWSWCSALAVLATVASRAVSPPGTVGITQRIWIASILAWGVIHAVAAMRRSSGGDPIWTPDRETG
jgi:hypothetical protein